MNAANLEGSGVTGLGDSSLSWRCVKHRYMLRIVTFCSCEIFYVLADTMHPLDRDATDGEPSLQIKRGTLSSLIFAATGSTFSLSLANADAFQLFRSRIQPATLAALTDFGDKKRTSCSLGQ